MKKLLLITCLTFCVQTTFCQNLADTVNVEYSKNSPERLTFGVGVPVGSGYMWIFAPNLNKFLDSRNIRTWNIVESIPLTINYQKNKFKISGGGSFSFLDGDISNDKSATTLNAIIFDVSSGYAIFSERNYFLYFNLGTGFAQYTRTIEIKNSQPITLASALQSGNGQGVVLKNTGAFLDFSFEIMSRTKEAKALGKSIKLGYRYGLQENAWNSTFNNFTEVPSDRIGNLYFQFTFTLPYRTWFSFGTSNKDKR